MPTAIAIGVSQRDFWGYTPHELKIELDGYMQRIKLEDRQSWVLGRYVESAVGTAVEHCLVGDKATSEYVKYPYLTYDEMQKEEEESVLLEDPEIYEKRAALEMQLWAARLEKQQM